MILKTLTHFTDEPFVFDRTRTYDGVYCWKPKGLWLSDESHYGWSKWCNDAEFMLASLKFKTDVTVDLTDVLCIRTIEELDTVTKEYQIKDPIVTLDWPRLKTKYKGLLITPYHHVYLYNWYIGWDCASAVVWDLSCVVSTTSEGTC